MCLASFFKFRRCRLKPLASFLCWSRMFSDRFPKLNCDSELFGWYLATYHFINRGNDLPVCITIPYTWQLHHFLPKFRQLVASNKIIIVTRKFPWKCQKNRSLIYSIGYSCVLKVRTTCSALRLVKNWLPMSFQQMLVRVPEGLQVPDRMPERLLVRRPRQLSRRRRRRRLPPPTYLLFIYFWQMNVFLPFSRRMSSVRFDDRKNKE